MKIAEDTAISPSMLSALAGALSAQAWVVGGWVRDRLLGAKSSDADVVVAGDVETAAMAAARSLRGSLVPLDRSRGVYRVALAAAHIDFTALRGSIEEDLAGRDFTINAMGLPASAVHHRLWRRHIIDPVHGLRDIDMRLLRHTSPSVFAQDPLRTLRALRLAATLRFRITRPTQRAIKEHAHRLSGVAAERIRDEFVPILRSREAHLHLAAAQRLGLLSQILPETQPLRRLSQGRHHRLDAWGHTLEALRHLNRLLASPRLWAGPFVTQVRAVLNSPSSAARTRADLLRFACLLHDIGKPAAFSRDRKGVHFYGHASIGADLAAAAARRTRLSRQEVAAVRSIVENHMRPLLLAADVATDRALRRLVADVGDRCVELAVLAMADLLAGRPSRRAVQAQKVLTVRLLASLFARPAAPAPLVNGHEIMERYRLQSGPMIGKLLNIVRRAQIEDGITTKEQAWSLLDSALAHAHE